MEVPLQIVFRNLDPSDSISFRIRERVAWLEQYCDHIIRCRVVVEVPHRHHQKGNLFHVRLIIHVPGEELVISRKPDLHGAYKEFDVALHTAFDEARRRLEDHVQRRRRHVKRHEQPPHAYVARLIREDEEYGFIRTQDGRELYFHRHSVLNDRYDDLQVGTEVRYSEGVGEQGPQASTVEVIGKQGKQFLRDLRRVS